jgi:GNAT superfamily N-acetyltransferase
MALHPGLTVRRPERGAYRQLMSPTWRIEAVTPTDWRALRAIRLEMLADTPLAFVETHADARAHGDDEWRARAARFADPHEHAVAIVDTAAGPPGLNGPNGPGWAGMARTAVHDGRRFLFSVYVRPALRATGAADVLVAGIEDWVRADGGSELYLQVLEGNARARAFYGRRGYRPTGLREPYPLDETLWELELRRTL